MLHLKKKILEEHAPDTPCKLVLYINEKWTPPPFPKNSVPVTVYLKEWTEQQNLLIKYFCSLYFRCLQFMNSIRWHVFWQCIFNFFEGFIVNGIINIILPALEKRYGLSSSRSGFIASGNDIGALVVLLFVGYFGERRHKPRLMAIGIFIMCFGCLLFALPQFIGDKYSYVLSGERFVVSVWLSMFLCVLWIIVLSMHKQG